jgi:uncharacterized protein (DUF1330 family)
MAAYVIFDSVSVHPDQMTSYGEKAIASLEAFGGKLIAASNDIDAREGDWHPDRIVIIEFPTMAKAQGWYESPKYQEVLPIRLKANRDKMVIVPGAA